MEGKRGAWLVHAGYFNDPRIRSARVGRCDACKIGAVPVIRGAGRRSMMRRSGVSLAADSIRRLQDPLPIVHCLAASSVKSLAGSGINAVARIKPLDFAAPQPDQAEPIESGCCEKQEPGDRPAQLPERGGGQREQGQLQHQPRDPSELDAAARRDEQAPGERRGRRRAEADQQPERERARERGSPRARRQRAGSARAAAGRQERRPASASSRPERAGVVGDRLPAEPLVQRAAGGRGDQNPALGAAAHAPRGRAPASPRCRGRGGGGPPRSRSGRRPPVCRAGSAAHARPAHRPRSRPRGRSRRPARPAWPHSLRACVPGAARISASALIRKPGAAISQPSGSKAATASRGAQNLR